jgi:prevent-host-death family protein
VRSHYSTHITYSQDALDKETFVRYNIAKLASLDIYQEAMMATKSISSTQAQNNFGQVLDEVTHYHTRYIIERRGVPQAILLSLDDFAHVLGTEGERQQMDAILRELRPEYCLGQVLDPTVGSK